MRRRRAEEREDAVPGQLRDGSAEAFHLLAHQPDYLVEEELRPLGAKFLGDGCRAGDVSDEDRHDPSLSGGHGHAGVIRRAMRANPRPDSIAALPKHWSKWRRRESNPRKMPVDTPLNREVVIDERANILHEHHQVEGIGGRLLEPVLQIPSLRALVLCMHEKDSNSDRVGRLDRPKQDVLKQ